MRLLAALLLALLLAGGAVEAQTTALTVASCGTLPLAFNPGSQNVITQDTTGKLCTSGTGGGGGSSTVNAIAVLPTLAPGSQTPQGSLAGAFYVQPVFGSAAGGGTQVDGTHGLPVNVVAGGGTPPANGATGSAVPAQADYIGGNLGGNLTGLTLTANGLKVDGSAVTQPVSGSVSVSNFPATQPVSGTVAATQSGTWTVQPGNTANTTAWKVDGSGVTQPVSGTVTANQGTANTAANAWPHKITDGTNTAAVKAASTAPAAADPALVVGISPNSVQNAASDRNVTGSLVNAGDTVAISTQGMATVGWYTTGSWVGTLVQEVTYDATGPTWFPVQTFDSNITKNFLIPSTALNSPTGQWSQGLNNDPWITNIAGAQQFRLRAVAMTSGTATVVINASVAPGPAPVYQSNANNLKARLSDGTNDSTLTPAGALYVNRRDSAGRELGASLPGQAPVPVVVAMAPTMPPPASLQRTIVLPAPAAAVTLPGNSPAQLDRAQVVSLSPVPSLQCPFVAAINQTSSTTVVTGQNGRRLHICSYKVISATAQSVSLIEGTGTACATSPTPLDGGTAGTNAYAANGGEANVSDRIIIPMQVAGDNLCVIQTGAGNVSGRITYGIY